MGSFRAVGGLSTSVCVGNAGDVTASVAAGGAVGCKMSSGALTVVDMRALSKGSGSTGGRAMSAVAFAGLADMCSLSKVGGGRDGWVGAKWLVFGSGRQSERRLGLGGGLEETDCVSDSGAEGSLKR